MTTPITIPGTSHPHELRSPRLMSAAAESHVEILQDESSSGPFEGPEKLLEIWFAPSPEELPRDSPQGLRSVPRKDWERMLDEVKCKVLSVIDSPDCDAYLLSESSMFVWPHKLILKTCGTTTLLLGLGTIIKLASQICSLPNIWRCFYSRKAFMFPEKQIGPHRDWNEEVKFLDALLGPGSAYIVGKMNGDHWLLYLTSPSALHQPALSLSPNSTSSITPLPTLSHPPDQTLEILMTHLDPSACAQFYALPPPHEPEAHAEGSALSVKLGISDLLPESTVDAFLFQPCGYSANILQNDRYATIHVTPEEECSYASFETNVQFGSQVEGTSSHNHSLEELIARVVAIFKPGRITITLFVSDDQGCDVTTPELSKHYTRTDRILYEFEGYDLVFVTFEKIAGKNGVVQKMGKLQV